MKLTKIRPSKIKIPELRVKSEMSEDEQQLLGDFLKGQGMISPIIAQEIDGELYLVDGEHRVEELISAGDEPVEVAILEGDMVDLKTRNIFLDHFRGKHRVSDMIRVLRSLEQDDGLDVIKIEEKTGLPRSYIEKILLISRAVPSVLEALDEGRITVSHAEQIIRLPSPVQQEELLAKQIVFGFRVADLKGFINQVLLEMQKGQEQPPAPPETGERPARRFTCEGCKSEMEPQFLRMIQVCPTCFGVLWKLGQSAEPQAAGAEKEPAGD